MYCAKHFIVVLWVLAAQVVAWAQVSLVNDADPVSNPKRTFAAIVGVNKYKYVTPLNYAVEDAKWFADFLKSSAGGQLPAENILLLVDSQAKSGNLLIELPQWLETRKLQEGDRLYVFLSGHGDAENSELVYFLPADCNPAGSRYHYRQNGFNLQYLKSDLKTYAAQGVEVIFIMDACRTNELTPGVPSAGFIYKSLLDEKFGGIQMLSTNASSVSIESADYGGGHGLFTYYLMDGLIGEADRNGDGYVSLRELQRHVEGTVEDAAQKKNKTQIPSFCCETANEKKIAKVNTALLAQYRQLRGNGKADGEMFVLAGNKGGAFAVADTLLTQLYARFSDALKEGRLTGSESAAELYQTLAAADTAQLLAENARYALLTEMVNFVQERINQYLDESNEALLSQKDTEGLTQALTSRKKRVAEASDSLVLQVAALANDLLPKKHPYKNTLDEHLVFLKARLALADNDTIELKKELPILIASAQKAPQPHLLNTIGRIYNQLNKTALSAEYYRRAIAAAPGWSVPVNNYGCLFYDVYKNYDSAFYYFNKSLQIKAGNSMALANIGQVYKQWGMYDSAHKYLAMAVQINPRENAYYGQLGDLYEKYNLYPAAIAIYKDALKIYPAYASGWNNLAWAYKKAGWQDSARASYRKMAAINSWNGYAWRMIAKSFSEERKLDSALVYFNKALAVADATETYWTYSDLGSAYYLAGDYKTAITYEKKVLAISDTSSASYNYIAYDFYNLQQHDSALVYARKAITLNPINGGLLTVLTDIYYKRGDIDSSDYYIGLLTRSFLDNMNVVRNLADHYHYERQEYAKAKNFYYLLMRGDNDDIAYACEQLGSEYASVGNTDSSIWAYRQTAACWPNYANARYNLGNQFLTAKQYDSAIRWYKETMAVKPSFIQAWVNAGAAFKYKKMYDSSLRYFKAAINIDGCFTFALTNLCYSFYDMGLYDSALQNSTRLDDCSPTTYRGNYIRGISLNKLKKHTEAIAELEVAYKKKPDHDYACYNIAIAYAALGNNDMALEWLEKAFINGFKDKEELQKEATFKSLQKTREYTTLVTKYLE